MHDKKVLYLISTLGGGGAENQLCSFAIEAAKTHPELDFLVCALKCGGVLEKRFKDHCVPYVVIGGSNIFNHIRQVIKLTRKNKFNIIHSHMFYSDIVARFVKVFTNVKIVATQHGLGRWKKWWLIILDRVTKGLDDRFIVVSEESKKIRLERERYPFEKTIVLHNGITNKFISPSAKTINKSDKIVVGTIARFTNNKQINILIDAFYEAHKFYKNLRLEIIGEGENETKLKKQSADLNIEGFVTFHGWVDDILPIIQHWNIFALCSLNEDLPLAVLETMAQGIVPVASFTGGIPMILKQGQLGILCNNKSSKSFSDGISKLIQDPRIYNQMSEGCINRVKESFLISSTLDQTLAVYDELMS